MLTQSNQTTLINEQFSRTEQLIGKSSQKKLENATVAVFGLGGVGSYTIEALARAGIGTLILIDNDVIKKSNINRQLYALHSTVDKLKVNVARQRVLDINPVCSVKTYPLFYLENPNFSPTEALQFSQLNIDLTQCSYIIDAIDTITSKLLLVEKAQKLNIPIISCMGTGNKLYPDKFEITDIYKTEMCPLARIIRKECKKRHIKHLKVLYSPEDLITKKTPPPSISFVPAVAGLMLAGEVIRNLIS